MAGYSFKVNELVTVDGTTVKPKKITVFIGPNNSGKSKSLKEIRSEILGNPEVGYSGGESTKRVVFNEIHLNFPANSNEIIDTYGLDDKVVRCNGGWRLRDYCNTGINWTPGGIAFSPNYRTPCFSPTDDWRKSFSRCFDDDNYEGPEQARREALRFFGPAMVDYVGTEDRLLMSIGDQAYGINDDNYNSLSSAYDTDPDCKTIASEITPLFNRDVVLDASTSRQRIVPVVSDSFEEYRGATQDMPRRLTILSKATPLREEGDGLRSFVSVLLSLMGRRKPVFLLDEPEAFLHPPYARRMGEILGKNFIENDSLNNVFISTHSSFLLQGLISSCSEELTIVRLNRDGDMRCAKVLSNKEILRLIDRSDFSAEYLDALFSSEAVLVEGPRDAAVYRKLIAKFDANYSGLFVSVNGKPGFESIKKFYDSAGIICKVITDFDLLDNNDIFKRVSNLFITTNDKRNEIREVRNSLERFYRELEGCPGGQRDKMPEIVKSHYKHQVYENLPDDLGVSVEEMLRLLAREGLVVLSSGELESLFEAYGVEYVHGSNKWLTNAFSYMANHSCDELRDIPAVAIILQAFIPEEQWE